MTVLTPRKRGFPMWSIPSERIIEALEKSDGMVYLAAAQLGCSAQTIYTRVKQDAKVRAVLEACREKQLDEAESALRAAVRRGEAWAVCFTLRTRGQKRGYIERFDIYVRSQRDRLDALVTQIMLEASVTRDEAIDALADELEGVNVRGLLQ